MRGKEGTEGRKGKTVAKERGREEGRKRGRKREWEGGGSREREIERDALVTHSSWVYSKCITFRDLYAKC